MLPSKLIEFVSHLGKKKKKEKRTKMLFEQLNLSDDTIYSPCIAAGSLRSDERQFYQNWKDDIFTFKEEERTALKTFLSRQHVLAFLNSIERKN